MKKLLILVICSCFLLVGAPSLAQENSSSDSATATVDYVLPYPGLLPDSPFYFLRTTRDRIVSILIMDPLKKAEFDLLQADKRLSAGVYLGNKNKYEMAVTVISKGENYLESAITQAKLSKTQGHLVGDIASNLYQSAQKHKEITRDLQSKTKGSIRASFVEEEKRAIDLEKKAKEINSAK